MLNGTDSEEWTETAVKSVFGVDCGMLFCLSSSSSLLLFFAVCAVWFCLLMIVCYVTLWLLCWTCC